MAFEEVETIIDISSYAGTDIKVAAGHIFVTSGSTGDLTIFNAAYAKSGYRGNFRCPLSGCKFRSASTCCKVRKGG